MNHTVNKYDKLIALLFITMLFSYLYKTIPRFKARVFHEVGQLQSQLMPQPVIDNKDNKYI